jgi:hypothetical protein
MAGRLGRLVVEKRDHCESAQVLLVGLTMDVDEIMLRSQQAMRRSDAVADVLAPAVERLRAMRDSLRLAHQELKDLWTEQQTTMWRG